MDASLATAWAPVPGAVGHAVGVDRFRVLQGIAMQKLRPVRRQGQAHRGYPVRNVIGKPSLTRYHVDIEWVAPSLIVAPGDDEARLLEWEVVMPKPTDAGAAARNVEYLGHETTKEGRDWVVSDPWGTVVRFRGARVGSPPTD